MLLETVSFLKENMKATIEEVVEEAELILEGGDPKRSASAILSIMREMLKTIDADLFLEEDFIEDDSKDEPSSYDFPPVDSSLKTPFKIGQHVKIIRGRCPFPPDDSLFKHGKITKSEKFGDEEERNFIREGQILYVFHSHYWRTVYVIEGNGKLYFAPDVIFER